MLEEMLAAKPHESFTTKPGAKRIVTFLHDEPQQPPKLSIDCNGVRILAMKPKDVTAVQWVAEEKEPGYATSEL